MASVNASADHASAWLKPKQVQRLRTACHASPFRPRLRLRNESMIALMYDAGLRVGELVDLGIESIDLDAGLIFLPIGREDPQSGPTTARVGIDLDPHHDLGTVRLVKAYLDNRAVESPVLLPSSDGGQLSPKAVRDVVSKAAEIAGVRPYTPDGRGNPGDVTPRTLRHGTAWRLLNEEDRSIETVRDRLRHSHPSTTSSLYARFDDGSHDESTGLELLDGLEDRGEIPGVLNAVPDVIYVFDTNGRFLWWNDRVSTVTGYSDREIANMHPLEFIADNDTEDIAGAIATVVERGTVETRESHLVTKEGRHLPYEFNGAPLTDDDGTVRAIVGSGRDISARRRATRAAEFERERFGAFADAVTDYAMFMLDDEGRIVSWNQGAERIKGYREADVLGEHFSILYPEEAIEAGLPSELLRTAMVDGRVEHEGWRVRKDGSRFWARVTITAVFDGGELRGFAKVTRDLTEQRHRERAIERQRDELDRLNVINAVIRTVYRAIVEATSRKAIEREVCDRLASIDGFDAVWICEPPSNDEGLSVRAGSGLHRERASRSRATWVDDERPPPELTALRSGSLEVLRYPPTDDDPHVESRPTGAERDGAVEVAAPIPYRGTRYGVLVVRAVGSKTIDRRHLTVLEELGEAIGYAIAASDRLEALTADSGFEVTLDIRHRELFAVRCAEDLDASVELIGVARQGEASFLEFFVVHGVTPAAVVEVADRIETVTQTRVIEARGNEVRCELTVTGDAIAATVGAIGGSLTSMRTREESVRATVELPGTADPAHLLRALRSTGATVELTAKRVIDRPIWTDHRFRSAVEERLTARQGEALRAAYYAGYFEQPRHSTGEQVASSLGISPSTFHQHVRSGLKKLLDVLTEDNS